jgi:hypothetical protein
MELIKYSPSGTQLWQHLHIGPLSRAQAYATALTLDAQENVVETGIAYAPTLGPPFFPPQTGYTRYETFKYSPSGFQLFYSSINAPPLQPGFPTDATPPTVAADMAGNSFIAAKTLVAKLGTNGQTLWLSNHVFLGSPVLCADPAGSIFIAGSATGSNATSDYNIVKRSGDGAVLWTRSYNGTATGTDTLASIACDGAGNAIVTGTSASSGASNDIVTLKYAPDGTLLWSARFDGSASGSDEGVAVKVNAQGDVYVTGTTVSTNGTKDFVLIKYAGSNGSPAWVRYFDGAFSANDQAAAAALDKFGNISIAGTSVGTFQSGFKTLQYDENGYRLWEAFYAAPGTLGITGLAANSGNEVYLTGYSNPSGSIVRPLIKYGINPTPFGGRLVARHGATIGSVGLDLSLIPGANYSLQTTTNPLSATNWSVVSNVMSLSGQMQLAVPATNAVPQFYRLQGAP